MAFLLLVLVSIHAVVSAESCIGSTSGTHKAIGCVANQGCCKFGLVVSSRCSGSQVCCYSSNICGITQTSGSCLPSSEMLALEHKLIEYEGIRYTAYDAQPTNSIVDWTICVGFNLKRSGARSVFSAVLPGVSFDSVYAGHTSLTKQQCMALFAHDLTETYIPRAQQVSGSSQFCGLPENVKIALVSAVYRGDLAYSHKTAQSMRAGNWCAVPAEYLNYYQYTHCRQLGIPGVCTRMKWNADQFQTMCNRG